MGCNWEVYFCDSGEILFYHNSETGEYRWPNGETTLKDVLFLGDVSTKELVGTVDLETGVCHVRGDLVDDNNNNINDPSTPLKYENDDDDNFADEMESSQVNETNDDNIDDDDGDNVKTTESTSLKEGIHKCPACGKDLTTLKNLKRHLHRYAKKPVQSQSQIDGTYRCTLCKIHFLRNIELRMHNNHYHNPNVQLATRGSHKSSSSGAGVAPLKCGFCAKTFRYPSKLKQHLPVHRHEMKPELDLSSATNKSPAGKHNIAGTQRKLDSKPYECNYCGERFRYQSKLREHKCAHEPPKETPELLNPDPKISNANPEERSREPCNCKYCGKTFSYPCRLKRHIVGHNQGLAKNYKLKCSHCTRKFCRLSDLSKHMDEEHKPERKQNSEKLKQSKANSSWNPSKCRICGKHFSIPYRLKMHMTTHRSKVGTSLQCKLCGKKFQGLCYLSRHIRSCRGDVSSPQKKSTKHEPVEPIEENFKDKTVEGNSNQHKAGTGNHVEVNDGTMKTQQKWHECKVCSKSFNYYGNYVLHQRRHELERKVHEAGVQTTRDCSLSDLKLENGCLSCANCSTIFRDNSCFVDHLQSDSKPLTCKNCDKSFRDQSEMTGHVCQVACPTCEKPFSCKRSLNIHNGLRHSVSCDYCILADLDESIPGEFRCTRCGKSYKWYSYFIKHLPKGYGQKLLKCLTCSRRFVSKEDQLNHYCSKPSAKEAPKSVESSLAKEAQGVKASSKVALEGTSKPSSGKPTQGVKPCPKKAKAESGQSKDSAEEGNTRRYDCNFCEDSLTRKDSLLLHIRVHEDVPPLFQCGICKKSYSLYESLRRHMRTNHSLEEINDAKIYRCNICKVKYKEGLDLYHHLDGHICKNPVFACQICPSQFRKEYNLRRHMKRMHKAL